MVEIKDDVAGQGDIGNGRVVERTIRVRLTITEQMSITEQ